MKRNNLFYAKGFIYFVCIAFNIVAHAEDHIDEANKMMNQCVAMANSAAQKTLGLKFNLGTVKLQINFPEKTITGGSAAFGLITIQGRPNFGVICHEVFHLVWETLALNYSPSMTMFPRNSAGKTTELYESLPQVFAILATGDCIQGTREVSAWSWDHCNLISRHQLPSARERYLDMKQYLEQIGDNDDPIVSEQATTASTTSPSSYDASRPLGAILFKSLDVCERDNILADIIWFLYSSARLDKESQTRIFDTTDTFGIRLLQMMSNNVKSSNPECAQFLSKSILLLEH